MKLSHFKTTYLLLFILGIISLIVPAASVGFITTALTIIIALYVLIRAPKEEVKKRGVILLMAGSLLAGVSFMLLKSVSIDQALLEQIKANIDMVDNQKLSDLVSSLAPGLLVMALGWIVRLVGTIYSNKEYRFLKKSVNKVAE
ncbi:hypothetical protein R4Y45_01310 [Holzapfeliella sp. He02]|uniref:Uncharacterized protein n=1 Tax=Holzapfeliella saturejae TaxID=3082953 RepID=A0ABU8SEV2_9LACO